MTRKKKRSVGRHKVIPPISRNWRVSRAQSSGRLPSALSALQSCKFIAACEDLFLTANQRELTRIKRARTPFKKQATRVVSSERSHISASDNSRQFASIRGRSFGCGGAALGNPRLKLNSTAKIGF